MAKKESSCLFRTSIGGQALIEGILMRGPEKQAIVVRSPEGLVTKVEELKLIKDKYPILGWPLIRGSVNFLSSMINGVKALMFSADYFPEEEGAQPDKLDQWLEKHVPAEKLQGVWIMEIGEMQGTRKADVDILKGFISRQVDEYRPAFGRVVEHRPRTTVIFGTTNTVTGFLRDVTGNRRFWPVPVEGGAGPWDITEEEVRQIWAEAKKYAEDGETTFLDAEMEKEAERMQREALEYDEREGAVIEYLETLLPEDFYEWDLDKRVDYFREDELTAEKDDGILIRERVSCMEIYCECFGKSRSAWKKQDGYDIAAIMARIPGWERSGSDGRRRDRAYGLQRYYIRKRV